MTGPDPRRVGDPSRGVRLAFGGAAFAALGIVPFKVATRDAAPEDIVVVVVLAAAVMNSTLTAGSLVRDRRAGRPPRPLTRVSVGVAVGMGVLAAAANFSAGQGVAELDASVSTLLIQTQVLMATALGWAWLGERVTPRFLAGALVALVGIAAIPEGGDTGASVAGVLWALAAAGCFGAVQVLTRRYIDRIDVGWVNGLRLWVAVVPLALVPGSASGARALTASVIGLAALAGLCGAVLSRLLMMESAKHIPAATTTLIGLSSPVIGVIADGLILDGLPGARAWIGGAIVAIGLLLAIGPGSTASTGEAPVRPS